MKPFAALLAAYALSAASLTVAAQGEAPKQPASDPASAPASTPAAPKAPATPADKPEGKKPAPATPDERKENLVFVTLETSKGNIVLELNSEKAPITVKNFVEYVQKGHYSGTTFHRVIPTFMIQGGGMSADMKEKATGRGIQNEGLNGLKNVRGAIAMARTNDPNSATAQFFINTVDNAFLDATPNRPGYAVFGRVIAGLDVVDQIKDVKTTTKGMHQNVPVEPITINAAKVITAEEAKTASGGK